MEKTVIIAGVSDVHTCSHPLLTLLTPLSVFLLTPGPAGPQAEPITRRQRN
jgi:hypothetical protein